MGRKKVSEEHKIERKKKYDIYYIKHNTKRYVIQVNRNTEANMIEFLDQKKKYGTYIKGLIKKDMEE